MGPSADRKETILGLILLVLGLAGVFLGILAFAAMLSNLDALAPTSTQEDLETVAIQSIFTLLGLPFGAAFAYVGACFIWESDLDRARLIESREKRP